MSLSPIISTAAAVPPIPKQRSLFSPTTTIAATSVAKSHYTKEQNQQQQQEQEIACATSSMNSFSIITNTTNAESDKSNEQKRAESTTTTPSSPAGTTLTTRLASSSTMREPDEIIEVHEGKTQFTSKSGLYAQLPQRNVIQSTSKVTPITATTSTGAIDNLTQQSHSKFESKRTSSLIANTAIQHQYQQQQQQNAITALDITNNSSGSGGGGYEKTTTTTVCGKILNKLQNNQFIKNQQSIVNTSPKYLKYKSYSVEKEKESFAITTSLPGACSTTGSGSGSPTKQSTTATNNINKKKMVAVQEMKKTTQNTNHNHHHHHHPHSAQHTIIGAPTICARQNGTQQQQQQQQQLQQQQQQNVNNATDFDPSEDLTYGPGIVSKLRCRYLSLALRESMEKCNRLENLRRTTSLNNLLDRDDNKDDEDDENNDEENDMNDHENHQDVDIEFSGDTHISGGDSAGKLIKAGILKFNNDGQNNEMFSGKKTTTFQKNCNVSGTSMNGTRLSQAPYGKKGIATGSGGSNGVNKNNNVSNLPITDSIRSRHNKRGNDSLKRARSVEALLCEKSPWNFEQNRHSFDIPSSAALNKQQSSGPTRPTCVTIEDKINNARDRLISGTDTMPPKRLTSIFENDTERPPPDLVKQTLKMFEATANRRPRGPNRTNGKGDVATKVANYKSIIKENKPAIVFPKPPISPTKKLVNTSPTAKPNAKPVIAAVDLITSPIGHKTITAATTATTPPISPMVSDREMQQKKLEISNNQQRTPNSNGSTTATMLSENSPDIIPKRHHKLLTEKSDAPSKAVVDSPLSTLPKKIGKLNIETDKQQSPQIKTPTTAAEKESQQQQKINTNNENSANDANDHNDDVDNTGNDNDNSQNSKKFVGGDASFNIVDDDKNDRIAAAEANETDILQAGGNITNSVSTSSDLSDDEYGLTKRVTKTALDNIAKAGTQQQFKFLNSDKPTKSFTENILNGSQQNATIQANNSKSDIPNSTINVTPSGKQKGVITSINNSISDSSSTTASNYNQQQHIETLKQHSLYTKPNYSSPTSSPSLLSHTPSSSSYTTPLTSREIEKNRINDMKKTAIADHTANNSIGFSSSSSLASTSTSLDTVINTNTGKAIISGFSELDNATMQATTTNTIGGGGGGAQQSPLWALRKKRQIPTATTENTSMVFNFSKRKEVPDYIENDGVIFRRKRELPKPNDSGFVLLGDLSLETSTDSDYDDFSLCPPSPCDVEFENANIVIDGKSSIRHKSKDSTFRVQFNDTLTSTFEYPSESSMVVDDSFSDHYTKYDDDFIKAFDNLALKDSTDSPAHYEQHHHVAVDEIIPIPVQHNASSPLATSTSNASATNTTPTKNILGNLPLGSAPLGFYTPVKAPIDNLFQLGVTRAPSSNGNPSSMNGTSSKSNIHNGDSSNLDINDGLNGDLNNENGNSDERSDSLQYLKPANDDLRYSEGTQKTDLLY